MICEYDPLCGHHVPQQIALSHYNISESALWNRGVSPNRRIPTVSSALKRVTQLYLRRGFKERHPEIQFNFCAQNEHVSDVERYIRTVKDRVRSCYNTLPFPRLMTICLISTAVFWLNYFHNRDGVSSTLSPRYLLTCKHIDYNRHVRAHRVWCQRPNA